MSKPTFSDIARQAGVGTATVERVLNGRGGVRPATAAKVIAAARALDYPRRLPEVHRGLLRIEVILVRPETTFFRRLSRAFERINATLDPSVQGSPHLHGGGRPGGDRGAHRLDRDAAGRADPRRARPSRDPAGRRDRRCRRPAGRPCRHPRRGGRRRSRQHRQLRRRAHRRALPVADAGPGRHGHGALSPDLPGAPRTHARLLRLPRREAARRASPSAGSASAGTRRDAAATCCSRRWRRGPTLSASTTSGRATPRSPMSCAGIRAGGRSSSSATS